MKAQRECIFCGARGGMSKEHFWPDWLGQYFSKSPEDGNISELHVADGPAPRKLAYKKERQGSVLTKKFRVVCRACNNGWMSALEERVKPALLACIRGYRYTLSESMASDLALWACVKAIVGEHAEGNMALTPAEDRNRVCKESTIPGYFRIFIGRHSSATQVAYLRHSTTVSRSMSGPVPPLPKGIARNIQSVTFLVGPTFFYVLAARVDDLDLDEVFSFRKIVRLWPAPESEIELSALPAVKNNSLIQLANGLDQLLSLPGVVYGGPLSGT